MKKLFCAVTLILFLSSQGYSQLTAIMQNCAFLTVATDTPYIETYIAIPANSVQYVVNASGKFEGAVEVALMYLRDTTLIAFDKYLIRTPEIADTTELEFSLIDLRRAMVSDGDYTVKLQVKDVNHPSSTVNLSQSIHVIFSRETVDFSDVELVDSYTPTQSKNNFSKNGYDMKPHPVVYYSSASNKLIFYQEIYNSNKIVGDEDILITYMIKQAQRNEVAGELSRYTKQKAAALNVLFAEFDITDLPSGNYFLDISVKNKKNEELGKNTLYFQRSNKNSITEWNSLNLIDVSDKFVSLLPPDSMDFYIASLGPIAESYEKDYISRVLEKRDVLLMKQFYYNFWQKRNNTDPLSPCLAYMTQVNAAEANYRTPIYYGFETDRGRVFLQYGSPNQIEKEDHEAGAYPYEIWHYYKLGNNQSNIHFVFYNPDLITNDFKLIHSDAQGEIYDSRWKFKIYETFKDNNGFNDVDVTEFRDTFGGQLDDNFNH